MSEEEKKATDEILEDTVEDTIEDVVEDIVEETIEGTVETNADSNYQQQAKENLEKYQRCFAEFDNFRKRTVKEKASMYDDGVRNTVEKILLIADNLERAVGSYKGDEEDSFFKGVQMTLKQFQDVMGTLGVEAIPSVGETFNPEFHSAVAHEDNPEYGENEIVLEMQKGYKYNDKVIRHSMVKVAN